MAPGSFVQRRLAKPHFLLRPQQAVRRLRQAASSGPLPAQATATLPWGLRISYDPAEAVGSSIHRTGVFELAVTETLYRLAEPGELALDVGGNIGYMASVLAAAVGADGEVLAFEPHPTVFERLRANAAAWPAVEAHRLALSDTSGTGLLEEPRAFASNQGTAALTTSGAGIEVELATLDAILSDRRVGVMKIDVEGNEALVLSGGRRVLAEHRVRDIVFEEHRPPPTPSTDLLQEMGYTLFAVQQRMLGLRVSEAAAHHGWGGWDAPTYVGTCEPERAHARLVRRGWRTLRPR